MLGIQAIHKAARHEGFDFIELADWNYHQSKVLKQLPDQYRMKEATVGRNNRRGDPTFIKSVKMPLGDSQLANHLKRRPGGSFILGSGPFESATFRTANFSLIPETNGPSFTLTNIGASSSSQSTGTGWYPDFLEHCADEAKNSGI